MSCSQYQYLPYNKQGDCMSLRDMKTMTLSHNSVRDSPMVISREWWSFTTVSRSWDCLACFRMSTGQQQLSWGVQAVSCIYRTCIQEDHHCKLHLYWEGPRFWTSISAEVPGIEQRVVCLAGTTAQVVNVLLHDLMEASACSIFHCMCTAPRVIVNKWCILDACVGVLCHGRERYVQMHASLARHYSSQPTPRNGEHAMVVAGWKEELACFLCSQGRWFITTHWLAFSCRRGR